MQRLELIDGKKFVAMLRLQRTSDEQPWQIALDDKIFDIKDILPKCETCGGPGEMVIVRTKKKVKCTACDGSGLNHAMRARLKNAGLLLPSL